MEGFGTFTGADGDTYHGYWSSDRKHGFGKKCYANGDYYEGNWRRNLQEGHGRYVWRNGSQYAGEWRGGVISGRDGRTGYPRAAASSPGPTAAATSGAGRRTPRTRPRGEKPSPDLHLGIGRRAGEITCDIVDALEASILYRDGSSFEKKISAEAEARAERNPQSQRKAGQTISKGHKNYDLMLNLQVGIRYSVGKLASSTQMRELRHGDFDPREKFWTRFPPEGSKITPPHQSVEFRWKDYCPMVFRHLRKLFAVDPADYMLAICGNDALRELSSPGKSGSFFYLTQDDRFMIKTVRKSEVKVLVRMLPSYFHHVNTYKNSLVTRFYGVHCVRFIVMGNLFCSEHRIHRRFDLKGSSHGRTTDKAEGEIDETTTLKDLDLNFVFRLQRSWFLELLEQIDRDCEFLEAEGIMDYSLLVGVHFRDDALGSLQHAPSPGMTTDYRLMGCKCFHITPRLRVLRALPFIDSASLTSIQTTGDPSGFEHAGEGDPNIPERFLQRVPAVQQGKARDAVLYFGIIDILQGYDISKRLEHAYKSLQVDPASISAVDPKLYSKRFRDFVRRTFVEDG
ncbi:unnamed protein product [Spirodela intermedia]|uniref:1-phosphatidylinositol-4-phosphate 5-kinase n=1 Tax=Spirodela intermedia TaxID=51605 RepID=A0A7I8J477_SPIIN|nr:unnamed protein product [Spirodela intermedia]CAA6664909.1 unnamed protein product [Spirodela intermedia]